MLFFLGLHAIHININKNSNTATKGYELIIREKTRQS